MRTDRVADWALAKWTEERSAKRRVPARRQEVLHLDRLNTPERTSCARICCMGNTPYFTLQVLTAPSKALNRNFHFGLPTLIQYKPNHHPLVLRTEFFLREPFPVPQGGVVTLTAKSKTGNSCLFSAFHKHLSDPRVLVTLISPCSSPPSTPSPASPEQILR